MKMILVQMLLVLFVVGQVGAAVGKYETFRDSQGRELQARLLSLDTQSDTVKLQMRNGKIRTTDIAVFSEADQVRIRNWHIAKVVFSEKNLIVKINKKSSGSERIRDEVDGWNPKTSGMKVEEIAYELGIENRNKTTLKGLKAEYRIHHQQEEQGNWVEYEYDEKPSPGYEKEYEENEENNPRDNENKRQTVGTEKIPKKTIPDTTSGTLLISEIPSKKRYEGRTVAVPIKKGSEFRPIDSRDGAYPKEDFPEVARNPTHSIHEERKVEGEVIGVIFRISVPLSSGGYARKEYSYPKDLLEKTEVAWDDQNSESSTEKAEKPNS